MIDLHIHSIYSDWYPDRIRGTHENKGIGREKIRPKKRKNWQDFKISPIFM